MKNKTIKELFTSHKEENSSEIQTDYSLKSESKSNVPKIDVLPTVEVEPIKISISESRRLRRTGR